MDIKISSDLPPTKPVVSPGDLLAHLKSAGSLEAEVMQRLQGKQLLLSSRLGEILTTNSLSFKPGDRLILRFDDSAGQAVLKASPRTEKPIILDSRHNPELARALVPNHPRLARVVRIIAQQAEIQLADQLVKMPRQLSLARNQLLSLRRADTDHGVEISRVDSKSIYKAILKQLLPQQSDNRSSSLVKLLELIRYGIVTPAQAAVRQPASPLQQSPENSIPAPVASAKTDAAIKKPDLLDSAPTKPGVNRQANASPALTPAFLGERIDPARQPAPTAQPISAKSLTGTSRIAALAKQTAALGTPRGANPDMGVAGEPVPARLPGSRIPATPLQPPSKRIATDATTRFSADANKLDQIGPARTNGGNSTRPPPAAAAEGFNSAGITPAPGSAQAATVSVEAAGASTALHRALQPLLQLVTRFPDIDANQIKKWLEFARLIYPSGSTAPSTVQTDIFTLLKQFGAATGTGREPSQAQQQYPAAQAGADSPTNRGQAAEALLQHSREALKLIEQSLSQNLLLRANLGMQQETQQPLALSIAIPFTEGEDTKPLYLDLAQRKQAPEEAEKSWDIRLSFELAGLGSIACHLVLEGCAIAASFFAEQALTRERIEAELPQLRQQLSRAGFSPGEFHSFPGEPAPARPPSAANFSETLIDIKV